MSRVVLHIFMMITLLAALFVPGKLSSIHADTNQDLIRLLESSSPWIEEHKKIVIKYGDFYKVTNAGQPFEQIGERLKEAFGFTNGRIIQDHEEHFVYESVLNQTEEQMSISMRLVKLNNHPVPYLTILITATERTPVDTIKRVQRELENQLKKLGCSAAGQVMIQGYLLHSISPRDLEWWSRMNDSLQLTEIDQYEDERTMSVSYHSTQFTNGIQSGAHIVNIQIALHQETDTNRWRFTIGTPMITIEY